MGGAEREGERKRKTERERGERELLSNLTFINI